jgi:polysaccharide deacetylase 2 family uncharacterized protein YibQ
MGGGVIIGAFWGLVVAVLVAAVLSLSAPLPPRDASMAERPAEVPEAEAPDGSTDGGTDGETGAGLPAPEVAAGPEPEAGSEPGPAVAEPPAPVAAPEQETTTARAGPADAIPLPAGSEFNRPPPEEAAQLPQSDSAPGLAAPMAPPAPETDLSGGIDAAPPPQPSVVAVPSAPAPVAPAPDDISALAPAGQTGPGAADAPPRPAPAPVRAPGLDRGALPDVTDPPPPAVRPGDDPAAAPQEAPRSPSPDAFAPEASAEAQPEIAADPPMPGSAPEPAAETAPADPAAEPAAPGAPAETPMPDDSPRPAAADSAADGAQTPPPDAAPQLPAPEPPAVVRLVPPRATTPPDDAGTPPGARAAEGSAGDAADAEPPRTAETQAAPRVIRPAAPPGEDAGTASAVLPQIAGPGRMGPVPGDAADDMGGAAPPDGNRDTDRGVDPPAEADAALPAIEAFAVPFDASGARALISVVLIDQPHPRLDLATLTGLDFPVAFAIDPARPDAAQRAEAYRAAGFEVLMLGTVIPEGATATDTEVALAAARTRVPEAVALMDTTDSRIQSDRPVLEAVVGVAAGEGQGLVAFPRGLNTAEQVAARADVPAATLFRLLDDEDQRATVITRFLSRAEFAATQQGAVIVAGRTRPATVTALVSWAQGARNAGVAIAPVSAALTRLAETE